MQTVFFPKVFYPVIKNNQYHNISTENYKFTQNTDYYMQFTH